MEAQPEEFGKCITTNFLSEIILHTQTWVGVAGYSKVVGCCLLANLEIIATIMVIMK